MKRKLIAWIVAAPLVILAGFAAWVYAASEWHLRSFERSPAFSHEIPTDEAAKERGEHIALTRGCQGCHGSDLAGQVMWDVFVAPNLPALARSESPATLEAAIRHGIAHNGLAMFSMPSYNFLRLTDEDIADLIAYLRSQPVVQKDLPVPGLPWPIRFAIATGSDSTIPGFLHLVPELRGMELGNEQLARGEYIAMTSCNECHGFSLRADVPWEDESSAPDLIIVSAYSEDAFRTLMTSGIALGNRELEMMSDVARYRFAHFTDDEISDLYAFLSDMAARAIAGE